MLTDKQALFVKEFIIDMNATAAYLRAGYKCNEAAARVNASKLLTNTNIQQAIQEAQKERFERVEWSADEILRDLKEIATDRNQAAKDRLKAYELGGKYYAMFVDKQKVDMDAEIRVVMDSAAEEWSE